MSEQGLRAGTASARLPHTTAQSDLVQLLTLLLPLARKGAQNFKASFPSSGLLLAGQLLSGITVSREVHTYNYRES